MFSGASALLFLIRLYRIYMSADCTFSHLGPDVPNIQVQQDAASAAFHACTFQNFISNDSTVGILEASGSSGLMVNASEFLQNDVDVLFVADDVTGTPLFYSDSSSEVVSSGSANATLPLPLSAISSSQIQFLDGEVGGSSEVAQVSHHTSPPRPFTHPFSTRRRCRPGLRPE